ncbi:ATP-dependent RNA helicase DBP10 [Helicocarpus griseus UAMH5409]|uniref:ATP-dependent RNA helicase DBP10 n=1 Tax=Helicocarpus griseus UAMH5409 TaxID=1447875 RepID=A0A2B7Y2V6_9EURO|nr:ATP-dependent RNA helicase DBP10 [Helicocarpus griseus UAMH5409]
MPHRDVSPAASENEFDITNLLFKADDDGSDLEKPSKKQKPQQSMNLDVMGDDDDGADDDEAFIATQQAAANRKASNLKGRTVKKGGGFQSMGLNATLLKAITRKGFSVPTPIQRKTIPLLLDDQDVVGMARTGSGKTAAFVVPMIEKLKSHSAKFGARALIMSPSRELALQTLKVVKELGRGTDLKSVLLVGGDSLEEQFEYMAGNPDIIIATPGRFLHLKVEMSLDLSSIRYVVFDEADRLFEMGFAAQLTEILHGLPSSRQTLLFSATLPKSLVEFARAGLQEPTLIRLDAESKISPDLQNAFFTVKSSEKEGALLHLLHDVIKIPTGETETGRRAREDAKNPKKRKRSELASKPHKESPTEHSTIIFAATKHHVDYLASVLRQAGFAVSYVYGSLDQTARRIEVQNFRSGITHILVVTDVAARGIDIPILSNVINYDFPSQPKIFVHRVGRTARAGRTGWSYSLIRESDAPYLLDLQLFLGRPLVLGRGSGQQLNYAEDVVVGSLARDQVSRHCEWMAKLQDDDVDIAMQRDVAIKGEKLYMRTRNSASTESAKRAKEVVGSDEWMMVHPLFNDESSRLEEEREKMLARVGGYKPQETIFEIGGRRGGKKGNEEAIDMMRKIRSTFEYKRARKESEEKSTQPTGESGGTESNDNADEEMADFGDDDDNEGNADNMSLASDSELEVTFSSYSQSGKSKLKKDTDSLKPQESFQNPEYFMSYTPTNTSLAEDRAYGVHSGSNSNFVEASRSATMDLNGDESASRGFGEPRSIMRWDKRHKKYVSRRNDEDGSKEGKGGLLVRGESGTKIAASFRSGRFDAWKKGKRINRMPRVGEAEAPGLGSGAPGTKKYRHRKEQAPKSPDKFRDDYEKKKKKVEAAKQRETDRTFDPSAAGAKKGSAATKGRGKSELKNVDDIRKARKLKEKRREKNARPAKKGKK